MRKRWTRGSHQLLKSCLQHQQKVLSYNAYGILNSLCRNDFFAMGYKIKTSFMHLSLLRKNFLIYWESELDNFHLLICQIGGFLDKKILYKSSKIVRQSTKFMTSVIDRYWCCLFRLIESERGGNTKIIFTRRADSFVKSFIMSPQLLHFLQYVLLSKYYYPHFY